jgi:hypothetical protein
MSITTQFVTTVGNVVYSSTGNTAVTWLSLNNWGPSNVTANLYAVPNGEVAGNINQFAYSLLLQSGDTYQIYVGNEKLLLDNGDFIQADATDNTVTAVTSYTSI